MGDLISCFGMGAHSAGDVLVRTGKGKWDKQNWKPVYKVLSTWSEGGRLEKLIRNLDGQLLRMNESKETKPPQPPLFLPREVVMTIRTLYSLCPSNMF